MSLALPCARVSFRTARPSGTEWYVIWAIVPHNACHFCYQESGERGGHCLSQLIVIWCFVSVTASKISEDDKILCVNLGVLPPARRRRNEENHLSGSWLFSAVFPN